MRWMNRAFIQQKLSFVECIVDLFFEDSYLLFHVFLIFLLQSGLKVRNKTAWFRKRSWFG